MNRILLKFFRKANLILKQQSQVEELLRQASRKLHNLKSGSKQINELAEYAKLFLKMIKKSLMGEYNAFSYKTLLSLVFGLLYFVTPMDVVPDFIPLLGFSDDLSVIYFIIKNCKSDIDAFKVWELNQRPIN